MHRKSIINQFPGLPSKSSLRARRAPMLKFNACEMRHTWSEGAPFHSTHAPREVHPRPATYRLLPGTNKCVRAASTDAKASRRSCALCAAIAPRCVAPAGLAAAAATTRTPRDRAQNQQQPPQPPAAKNARKEDARRLSLCVRQNSPLFRPRNMLMLPLKGLRFATCVRQKATPLKQLTAKHAECLWI